jgi:hypothetical protein
MDPIGVSQLVTLPTLPAQPAQSTPALPAPSAAPSAPQEQVSFNAQAAEQSRADAVLRAAQQIANVFVIGDQTFSLFKDATGQYITRFTNLRDGKVTYIPEPTLFKMSTGGGSGTEPLVKIQA